MSQQVTYTANLFDKLSPGLEKMARNGQAAFNRIDGAADQVHASTGRLTAGFGALRGALAGIGLGALVSKVFAATSNFERFDSVLTNTLGSARAADEAGKMLSKFASNTPFELEALQGGFLKLVNRGLIPTQDEMKSLGDLASSQGKTFDELTEAFLDAGSGEFERLKEFGIRAKNNGKTVAFTFKGVTTQVENSEAAINQYLLSLGKQKGVAGSMSSQMQTLGGIFSNVADQATAFAKKLGTFLRPVFIGIAWAITGVMSGLSAFIDGMQAGEGWALALATGLGILAAVGLASVAWGMRMVAWSTLQAGLAFVVATWPILLISVAIAAAVAALVYFWNTSEKFRSFLYGLWESVKTVFKSIGQLAVDVFGGLGEVISGIFTLDPSKMSAGIAKLTSVMATGAYDIGKKARESFLAGQEKGVASFRADAATREQKKNAQKEGESLDEVRKRLMEAMAGGNQPDPQAPAGGGVSDTLASQIKNTDPSASGGGRGAASFVITTLKAADTIIINNVQEASESIQKMVTQALMTALNDYQATA